jgi:aminocarboxymuconate-semialdehyde decarboxylase
MRWDTHNHAVPESLVPHLRSEFPVSVDGHIVEADRVRFKLIPEFTDPAAKLERLQEVGLDAAVVSLVPALFCYHADPGQSAHLAAIVNDSLAEFCASEPGRLRWMAHVPLQDPASVAGVIEQAKGAGAVGVEVGTSMAGKPLDLPDFDPLWTAASQLGLPVMIHPAYNAPHPGLEDWYLQNAIGNLLETTIAAERLMFAGHTDRYPSLRLLLLHGGGFVPWQIGRLLHARDVRPECRDIPGTPGDWLRNVMFDTLTHDPEVLGMLVRRVGADHLVMGTDAPFDMASPSPVSDLLSVVDEVTARQVMEENPARLFGLGSPS